MAIHPQNHARKGREHMQSIHKTVLLKETIEGLNLAGNPTVVDCTFGGGGHTLEVLKKFPKAKVIALDQDKEAFEKAKHKFEGKKFDISFANANFRDLLEVLEEKGVKDVDAIIFDLGLSSDQLENSGRGFSFQKDEQLFMTMTVDPKPEDVTAYDIVNTWSEESIADILYGYGEERYARRIARVLKEEREKKEIKSTLELVKIIERAVPTSYRRQKIHFATRTFQALRMAVNDELGTLEKGLESAHRALKGGGRMAVITFHSLEDRKVKKFFVKLVKEGKGRLINKKPITAGTEEVKNNPRSRSAKLRILEK